ncbi:hypothetical protein M2275_007562 [Rhodococcus opacus]|jgi:hypothetical protein|nr:hypothetical protein [Rhodococcus opacus]
MTLTGYDRDCSEIVTQTELPAATIDGADMTVPVPG